jgi:hypothetical protein
MEAKPSRQNHKYNQKGVASIFVVMTLMTLLALISIGFSRLMNREVRQSLDRQLSTAAYYAAESGINDSRDYVSAGGAKIDGCPTASGDNHPNGNNYFVTNGDISGDGLFKYSCVIINPTPNQIHLTIAPGQSQVIKLSGSSLSSLSRLYFSWQNAQTYQNSPQPLGTYGSLPQQASVSHDNTGLLRVGLYPMVGSCSDAATYNRYIGALGGDTADATLECAARNYFMYPDAGSGAAPNCGYSSLKNSNGCVRYDSTGDNGGLVPGNCVSPTKAPNTSFKNQASPQFCNSVVSNLTPVSAGNANAYYLRLTAVYQTIQVFIQATDNAVTPNSLPISNAEAIIDITGTGNDVLRRVQTYAPLQVNNPQFNYGLQSMESVCKLFRNDVPQPGIYDNPHLDGSASAFNTDNGGNNCSYPTGTNAIDPGGLPPVNIEPPPSVTISANPNPVTQGASSTLTWSSADADSCTGGGFNTGGQTAGSATVGPINSATTYTITCTGPSGSTPKSVTVNVLAPPSCSAHFSFSNNPGDGNTSVSWGGSGCESYYFDESEAYGGTIGNCTPDTTRCWVGDGSSGVAISVNSSFCWTYGAATAANGTLATDRECYNYSPPSGGGNGGGSTETCTYGGSISVPPGCSGCWDGSTATSFSLCPPGPPIFCNPLCAVFGPPENNSKYAVIGFSTIARLLPW